MALASRGVCVSWHVKDKAALFDAVMQPWQVEHAAFDLVAPWQLATDCLLAGRWV